MGVLAHTSDFFFLIALKKAMSAHRVRKISKKATLLCKEHDKEVQRTKFIIESSFICVICDHTETVICGICPRICSEC